MHCLRHIPLGDEVNKIFTLYDIYTIFCWQFSFHLLRFFVCHSPFITFSIGDWVATLDVMCGVLISLNVQFFFLLLFAVVVVIVKKHHLFTFHVLQWKQWKTKKTFTIFVIIEFNVCRISGFYFFFSFHVCVWNVLFVLLCRYIWWFGSI